jgi:hypothetical protein
LISRLWTLFIAAATLAAFLSLTSCGPGSDKITEVERVTSPNGRLDAALLMDIYGPVAGGGVDSNVYIVPKNGPVNIKKARKVFSADPMTKAKLVWERGHRLEIHYDIAYVHEFRNTWDLDEVQTVDRKNGYYEVELKLVSESDSAALKPDGTFRHVGLE